MPVNTISGTDTDDTLTGTSGNDSIVGLAGNDILDGGAGNDTLSGGADDDTLEGGSDNDSIEGDSGEDTLSYASSPSGVTVTMPQTASMVTMGVAADGYGGVDVFGHGTADILIGSNFDDVLTGSPIYIANWGEVFGNDDIQGGGGNDLISGLGGDDDLSGDGGNDALLGGDGNDELDGGLGNDSLDGGDGFDVADYGVATGAVSINLGTGVVTGAAGIDILSDIEAAAGSSHNDTLIGSSADDLLGGMQGDDILDGGDGFDGAYYGDATGGVSVNLAAGTASGADGNDTLVNFEGSLGSGFDDLLVGDGNANLLRGADANDTLEGAGGDDTLEGGSGSDVAVFNGSLSDYTLAYDSTNATLTLADNVEGRDGTDTLHSIEALQFSDQTLVMGGGAGPLDPTATYLSTAPNDPASPAQSVLLSDIGLAPGDVITLTQLGDYQPGNALSGFSDTRASLLAVFSNGTSYVAPAVYLGFTSSRQATTQIATDLPEDFFVMSGGTTLVQIPVGATTLLFSPNDSFFSDNTDPDGDYGIAIRRLDAATGFAGNDLLFGTPGDDTLLGGTGRDTLAGGAGNDFLDGGVVTDRINYTDLNVLNYAQAPVAVNIDLSGITGDGSCGSGIVSDGFGGTDEVSNVNFITGSDFDDIIVGSSALIFEEFIGRAGNDIIDGGAIDANTLQNSNRVNYSGASAAVTVDFTAGTASGGGQGTDTLININHVRGSAFNDSLTGSGSAITEQFEGHTGDDTIDGMGGIDLVRYDNAASAVDVNLATGVAQDGLGGVDALLNIEGIRGSAFDDVLTGGNPASGSGVIDGFEFFIGNGGDDTIDGGAGYDRVDYTTSTSGVFVTLGGANAGIALDGMEGIDTLVNIEAVRGSAFDDVLAGSDNGPFESFEGRDGDDTIDGMGGLDRVDFNSAPSGVIVDLAQGTAQDGLGGTDTLINIENVRGTSFDDAITGDGGDNKLEGGAGHDTLAGGAGNDLISGLGGDDELFGDGDDDTLQGGEGDDELRGGLGDDSLDGGDGLDVADYGDASGTVNVNLNTGVVSGAAGNDELTGIEAVSGSVFADTLVGSDGDDFLGGQQGNDILDGGAGFDVLLYADAGASVLVNLAENAVSGADGIDAIANFEGVQGSGFNDTLVGDAGPNSLEGGAGDDAISGGSGDDTLEGGPGNDTLDGGDGTDTARFAGVFAEWVLRSGSQPGELIVSGPEGQDVLRNIEVIRFDDRDLTFVFGTADAETLTVEADAGSVIVDAGQGDDIVLANDSGNALLGGDGNDQLQGGDGDDNLDGGTGNDAMTGGAGNDTYVIDSATDVVVETEPSNVQDDGEGFQPLDLNLGGGIDKVLASINYTLGAFVENLTLAAGAGDLSGTGNSLDNVLLGNASNNLLEGLDGSDSLSGEGGNDTLVGGAGNDTVDGGSGSDTATFAGTRGQYYLSIEGQGYQAQDNVPGRDGTDLLMGLETLVFADCTVDLTMGQKAVTISAADLKTLQELYVGFFNRIPEAAGLSYWIGQVQAGATLTAVADQFYSAGVQFGVYSETMTEAQFITAIYANVLGRTGASAPNSQEVGYWQGWLHTGTNSKGAMVLQMLSDSHNFFTGDPVVGWVIDLLDNKAEVATYFAIDQGMTYNDPQTNISRGIEVAAAITPTDTAAAIALIGLNEFPIGSS